MTREPRPQVDDKFAQVRPLDGANGPRTTEQYKRPDAVDSGHHHDDAQRESQRPRQHHTKEQDYANQREPREPEDGGKVRGREINS